MIKKSLNKKIYTLYICFALCLFLLSGCKSSEGNKLEEIRIGFFPNITHAQALYAKNTGVFDDAFDDVNVKWIEFNAGPSEIEAMFAGEVDIGYIGPIPAINGNIKSAGDVQVLAGASEAGAILVTRPDLILSSPKELDGLKVAIPQLGNTQHISLLNILSQNGLKTTDKGGTVEIVAASNADIMILLDGGNVDAALVPEPWGTRMVSEIDTNILLDEKEVWRNGEYPVALVIVNADFMKKNPQYVEAFLEAHDKVTSIINNDYEAAQDIINQELLNLTGKNLDGDVLSEAFSRLRVTSNIELEVMEEFIEILEIEGLLDEGAAQYELIVSR